FVFSFERSEASDKCKQWQSSWGSCKSNSDCVLISNPCGWPTSAANKQSSEQAKKCNILEGAALSCPAWNKKNSGNRIAICDLGECKSVASTSESKSK
ncbi:MAG: hypothetical protein ACXVCP_19645, partial [Bdellovibrio sp.]